MRCKQPCNWSSSRAEGRRKTLCGLLCQQDTERGLDKLHYHREGADGSVVYALDKFRAYLAGSVISARKVLF